MIKEGVTIDLRKLNWEWMRKFAEVKPMDVHKARERIRKTLIEVGTRDCPELAAWAIGLSTAALDFLVHTGFSEAYLFETLTASNVGDLTRGMVNFIGTNEAPKSAELPKDIHDGQHRQIIPLS